MYVSRCSLSMMHCEDITTVAVPNICERFSDRDMLWTPIFDQMQPPLKCPIRKVSPPCVREAFFFSRMYISSFDVSLQGIYRVIDSPFDMAAVQRLPMDPEKINVNLTLFEYVPDKRQNRNVIKRQLICLDIRLTITLSKSSNTKMLMSRRNGARPKN